MVHGDQNGLSLPPRIAPIQAVIVPVMMHKEGVTEKATEIADRLKKAGVRIKLDVSDQTPGWKFAEYEMKGVPLRIEIGPRDIENNKAVIVRRDNGEKKEIDLDNLENEVGTILDTIQVDMLERARAHRDAHTYSATNYEEFLDILANKPGFVKAMWCGDVECENKIKEDAVATSRCMPFEQETLSDKCVCCGKPAKTMVYWGKAY